ncbi:MAG: YdcF family protein [Hyphomicrobiales bacterium]|nr:YdcF family protein [Hyphomicrobiales bacterium]
MTDPAPDPQGVPQQRRLDLWVAGLVLALLLGLGAGFFGFVNSLSFVQPKLTGHAQGAVVLTGGADRVVDGVRLIAEHKADKLLITGVNKITSSRAIASRIPQFNALFSCCITLGYTALNTAGNARETELWARAQHISDSLIIVTSNYHMPRALLEISHAMPRIKLVPFPVINHHTRQEIWNEPELLRLVALEYVKYLYATVRNWLVPFAPSHEVGRLRPGNDLAHNGKSG